MLNILTTQWDPREDYCPGHLPESLEHRFAGILEEHIEDLSVQLSYAPVMKWSRKDALELLFGVTFVHKFD